MTSRLAYGGQGRSNERTLRQPAALSRDEGRSDARRYFYEPLARVAFRHGYYNRDGGRCSAFRTVATAATAALMRAVGLQFRDEGTSFSVLYDERRSGSLLGYLRRQATPEGAGAPGPVWTRLTFALVLRDNLFVNFTRMPLGTNPVQRNFYFTNRCAQQPTPDGPALLDPPGCTEGGDLVEVVGTEVARSTPPDVERVEVRAISGEVVASAPRCVPGPGGPVCTNRVTLDFSSLPEDEYSIVKVGADGRPVHAPRRVLYTLARPIPIALVDLLFTSPGGAGGIFPVRDLFQDARIVPAAYVLAFEARACTWIYDLAPRDPREGFTDLRIEGPPPVWFRGPTVVRLADGAPAYRFESVEPLLIEQQSPLRLRLVGRRSSGGAEEVLMDRLPVPGAAQVEPAPPQGAGGDGGDTLPRAITIVHV